MGAWGVGVFDDDTACDVIQDVLEEGAPVIDLIEKALSSADSEYIEYTECHEIIVAAALVNAMINNVSYDDIDDLDKWLAKQNIESVLPYKGRLANALTRVLGESSELNELWAESEDDYPTWKGNLEAIIAGLNR